jgi:hypothetical protein
VKSSCRRAFLIADSHYLWLANCYFARDSSGFPRLAPFYDAQSSRSSHNLLYIDCLTGANRFVGFGPLLDRMDRKAKLMMSKKWQ